MIIPYLIFYVGLAMAVSLIFSLFLRDERDEAAYLGNTICGSFGSWIASYLFSASTIHHYGNAGTLVLGISLPVAIVGAVAGVILNIYIYHAATGQYKKSLARTARLNARANLLRARGTSAENLAGSLPPATQGSIEENKQTSPTPLPKHEPAQPPPKPKSDVLIGPGGFKKAS